MRTLAIYYEAPEGVREKYVIEQPSDLVVKHWADTAIWIKSPDCTAKKFIVEHAGRLLPLPEEPVGDWLLFTSGLRTVRLEEVADHSKLTLVQGELGAAA